MATDSNKFPAWLITFVLFSFFVSVFVSSQCTDGTYEHEGRDCCLCGAGLYLVEHCSTSLQYGKCEPCEDDRFSSFPNNQKSCDRCTSCSQPYENLEEDEPCTPARDRKCRCKKDHYCTGKEEICRLCQPCKKCGAEGIKVPCAGHNNTVCNDEAKGGNHGGIIAGIIVTVTVLLIGGAVLYVWIRKRRRQHTLQAPANGKPSDETIDLLKDVDPLPHLPDIAEVMGWKDMKDVAIRSSMPMAVIDSCQLDHPHDFQEQTLQLLRTWVERQGRGASENLIKILHNSGKKGKAEKVTDILCGGR